MPALSPERFLKLPITVECGTISDAKHSDSGKCDCIESDFRVYPWPDGIDSCISSLEDLLRRYKYNTFEVTALSCKTFSPSNRDTMQERYLGPTLEVLNRHLFDPMLGLPPLRAYIADVEHGPMRIALISMNDPHDDTLGWCSPKETFDAKTHKKCFGIAIFLVKCPSYLVQMGALTYLQRPGVIRPQAFPPPSPINLEAPPIVHCAITAFLSQSQQMHCVYGMITDEITSVVFDETDRVTGELSPGGVVAEALSTTKVPIRLTLAMFANEVARKSKGFSGPSAIHVLQGALPPLRSPEELELNLLARRHFRDFDLFTMQRSEEEWWTFCEWKRINELTAKPLQHGDVLALERDGFSHRFLPWRSPYPNHPVPPETENLVKQFFRPRDTSTDLLMASSTELSFEISDVCRANRNTFSQVFFGNIAGSSHPLCLKLFDERFFPTPNFEDVNFSEGKPCYRLLDLNFAENMVRCEEAAYNRIAYLQGYIIPHCYGFHVFTLPDGWEVLGFLMEVIDAPSLSRSGIPSLCREVQATFLTRLRHAVRALKFAGITQPDWHLDQVLCPQISDVPGEAPGVVLIDFAFTKQHLGDVRGTPVTPDIKWLRAFLVCDLGIDRSLMDECWFAAVEEEYC